MTTFFSFGGGVQSTAIACLMVKNPELLIEVGLELPSLTIFADTGAEKTEVYNHISRVFKLLNDNGFKTLITNKRDNNGNIERLETSDRIATVPFFSKNKYGEVALLRQQCTKEFKIIPVQKAIKQHLGIRTGRSLTTRPVGVWLGISTEEASRMGLSRVKWIRNVYPLIELGWNRAKCGSYAKSIIGYNPPKSSCYFCPFTANSEWQRRKIKDPVLFEKGCQFDEKIRNLEQHSKLKTELFIHSSGLPLRDAVSNQLSLDFDSWDNECSGHCGL